MTKTTFTLPDVEDRGARRDVEFSSLYANRVAHSRKLTEDEKLTWRSTLPVCRRFYRLTNSLTIILFGKVRVPRNEKSVLKANVDKVPYIFVATIFVEKIYIEYYFLFKCQTI